MRKLCLGLAAIMLAALPTAALAAPLTDSGPPPHWDTQECPTVYVNLGGGSGYKHETRLAVDWYNRLAAGGGREGWPRLVAHERWPAWDGIVRVSVACYIDVDEVPDLGGNTCGLANTSWRVRSGHIVGASILYASDCWAGGGFNDQYIARHALLHTLGLGHNFGDCASVMSYCYRSLGTTYSDRSTLSHLLYPRDGHH